MTTSRLRILTFLFSSAFLAAHLPVRAGAPGVELLRAPDGGVQPQAVVDSAGTVHMIYAKTMGKDPWSPGDLFYVRMKNGEKEFSAPIQVNSEPRSVIPTGTTGGGQIAVGSNGRVHIVWNGKNPPKPKTEGGAAAGEKKKEGPPKPFHYTRLSDDGASFEPQRNLAGKTESLDGSGTVAADSKGSVYVLWHARGPTPGEEFRAVYMVRSTDDGKTFDAERSVNPRVTGACACCSMRAAIDAEGRLYVTYRAAGGGTQRDSLLLFAPSADAPLEEAKLGEWVVNYCPASSYGLAPTVKGTLAAWELKNQVYFGAFDREAHSVSEPVLVPGQDSHSKYPVIAQNARGEQLVAWIEGGAYNKVGSAAWQVFGPDNHPLGEKGESPGVPPSSQLTAFARPDGGFTIVY